MPDFSVIEDCFFLPSGCLLHFGTWQEQLQSSDQTLCCHEHATGKMENVSVHKHEQSSFRKEQLLATVCGEEGPVDRRWTRPESRHTKMSLSQVAQSTLCLSSHYLREYMAQRRKHKSTSHNAQKEFCLLPLPHLTLKQSHLYFFEVLGQGSAECKLNPIPRKGDWSVPNLSIQILRPHLFKKKKIILGLAASSPFCMLCSSSSGENKLYPKK